MWFLDRFYGRVNIVCVAVVCVENLCIYAYTMGFVLKIQVFVSKTPSTATSGKRGLSRKVVL